VITKLVDYRQIRFARGPNSRKAVGRRRMRMDQVNFQNFRKPGDLFRQSGQAKGMTQKGDLSQRRRESGPSQPVVIDLVDRLTFVFEISVLRRCNHDRTQSQSPLRADDVIAAKTVAAEVRQ